VCWIEWAANSPTDALKHAEELAVLANEHGFPLWLGWGIIHRGWSLVALGQIQEGLSSLTEGLSSGRATGGVTWIPWALTLLAEAYAKLGRFVEARDCLAEAAQITEVTDERFNEAEIYRGRGDLLDGTGDRTAAEHAYHQALIVANRQGTKIFELRATISLARLC
jgi:predicted ATPase